MIYRVSRCFLCRLAGFSEHGIFHGILTHHKNKLLIMNGENCSFTIEWE